MWVVADCNHLNGIRPEPDADGNSRVVRSHTERGLCILGLEFAATVCSGLRKHEAAENFFRLCIRTDPLLGLVTGLNVLAR